MRQRVAAVFDSWELAEAAARLLRSAGLSRGDITLLSNAALPSGGLLRLVRCSAATQLRDREGGALRRALIGAVVGSFLLELPVLVWLFVGLNEAMARQLGMGLLALRVLIATSAWKFGAVLGGYVGIFMSPQPGPEAELLRRYQERLESGGLVMLAQIRRAGLSEVRGILIESTASLVGELGGPAAAGTGGPGRGLGKGSTP